MMFVGNIVQCHGMMLKNLASRELSSNVGRIVEPREENSFYLFKGHVTIQFMEIIKTWKEG